MAKKNPKTFILDTNVILHDPTSLQHFQENNIVIPITVIEEIDHFKRGSQVININARQFARTLDSLTGKELFNGGISLGKGKGKIRIAIVSGMCDEIKQAFREDTPDHRILSCAFELEKESKVKRKHILVTKDVNLRMKAKALGILAEDYTTDRVQSVDELYSGKDVVEDFDDEILKKFYEMPFQVETKEIKENISSEFVPNKFFIIRNTYRSVLASLDSEMEYLNKVDKNPVYGITPRNAEQTFATNALLNPDIPLVTLTGKAGTGKTLIALASALQVKKQYRQIFIARPIVPLSNKDIGFLPGDVESKIGPYIYCYCKYVKG